MQKTTFKVSEGMVVLKQENISMERLSLAPSSKLAHQFGDIAENLEILNEECGEVVQMKSKIYRSA